MQSPSIKTIKFPSAIFMDLLSARFFLKPISFWLVCLIGKKYFNLLKTEKEASRSKAIQIFPYISSKLSRKKDSNKADAILIASYFNNTRKEE